MKHMQNSLDDLQVLYPEKEGLASKIFLNLAS